MRKTVENPTLKILDKPIQPFLKWAGGKRWLVSGYSEIFPEKFNTYIEPFLGSGAVFFHLNPKKAILSDVNEDLINTYRAIQKNWKATQRALRKHHVRHSKSYYYKVRNSLPRNFFERAARFIYLNRTCWNALYRVNLKGEFNVPIGTKTKVVLESDNFEMMARKLKNVKFIKGDFGLAISKAKKGDFLFVDPPYTVKHNNNGFVKYNETLFSWADQERLGNLLLGAKKRGVIVYLTNAYNRSIINLYKEDFELTILRRISKIAADSSKRLKCRELLVRG